MNDRMKKHISEALHKVAEDVLEKLAFIFSFPEEEREDPDPEGVVGVGVTFSGPFNGILFMRIAKDILPELAGNMLGIDEDETTGELQHDALKELLNVVCGNLLPALAGKERIFNVGAPVIHTDGGQGMKQEPVGVARLDLEDRICDLMLFVEGDLPSDLIAP